ncbi:luc7-like protein 3 isoform X1 [Palaemon carinicauda]|uniref:luc7-like protein 3 isoform X1 n=1 Tax=Palaemon carinicauda TaxID=392227 RepID=UPI0035B5A2D3
MATQAAAALLDELMGRTRNVLPNERNSRLHWDSIEVCRHFLVKFCPHDLFTNTKSDLGPCEKVHDEDLKREFEAANSYRRTAFEDEFIRYAESMLTEVDKRIKKGKQRLSLSVKDALASSTTGDGRVDEQLELLSERITGLVSEAERLGSEGNIEEAQGLLKLCDQLREERDSLRRSNENSVWHQAAEMAASQEKQMEVCEVCGAFLIVGDAQQRIDDHLTGKQHVGFAKLRQAIQEIRDSHLSSQNREKARSEREALREKDRESRHRALLEEEKRREREKEDRRKDEERRRRGDDRDRERRERGSRDRDRDRRDRHDRHEKHSRTRSRSRSRSHRGSHDTRSTLSLDRDRERDRRERDRDRDSHRRDRDRERERDFGRRREW